MFCAKLLQAIGLSSAFIGAVFLSIDTFGKERTCNFIIRWVERFRRHREVVFLAVGIVVAIVALFLIDLWRTPLINTIVPLMFRFPYISIYVSIIPTLAIVQLVIGGRASFGRIGSGIVTIGLVCYRVITNPSRWKPLFQQLRDQIMAGFRLLIHPSRIVRILLENRRRVISILSRAYFYIIVLCFAIFYVATGHPVFWVYSITLDLSFIITFSFVMLGFFLAWVALRVLEFFVSEDVEKAFSRLSFAGFVLLGLGFILQLFGIILW